MIQITQSDVEAFMCRPLTPCEANNLALHIENVRTQLIDKLCFDPFETAGVSTKTFEYRENHNYYLLQPYTNISSVSIGDCDSSDMQDITCDWQAVDKQLMYITGDSCAFGLRRCGCPTCSDLTCCGNRCKRLFVTADWNSCDMDDLKLVAMKMIEQDVKTSACNDNVKSKQIRSMTITYKDVDRVDYLDRYKSIINKWSVCNVDIA